MIGFCIDLPRSSSGVPASSVSRPVRDTRPRTSSNASTNSKRGIFRNEYSPNSNVSFSFILVSFDNPDEHTPARLPNGVCSLFIKSSISYLHFRISQLQMKPIVQ
jgi:hypothetical protein